ncbi:MAG: DUF3471 domain-containing protein [Gemmatimonadaceae bacterium]
MASYAGTYRNALLGVATVRLEGNGALSIAYASSPGATGDLEHVQHDAFTAVMKDPMLGTVPVIFRIGSNANVESMNFALGGSMEWKRDK